jgi:hypothetical protein
MKPVTTKTPQRGMTYLGMLILMVVIAFAAIVVIKVMPLYTENFKVQSSLKSLAEEVGKQHDPISPSELERLLLNRFSVNDIEHVGKDDIEITKENGRTVITVSYEARVSLFYNLDLVARFPDNRVDLGGP